MTRITRLQNSVIKTIFGCNNDRTYKENGILRLEDIYRYCTLVKFYCELSYHNPRSHFRDKIGSFQTNHDYVTRFSSNDCLIHQGS